MFKALYNPDVLTCLANLSSDEVFTPPATVNMILDLLPQSIWSDEKVTFLDPATKSGVFLREITKRLMDGLSKKIPNRQDRINHILQNQVYGIAITELTALTSRRTLYCSKYADSQYSIATVFSSNYGNIHFPTVKHNWSSGRCTHCGASEAAYSRESELEEHAYGFIHPNSTKEFSDVRFDVIIGNPPYQLSTGGSGAQAKPIYQLFVQQAIKLSPRYICMIIPSRWFAGGMGLDSFRSEMLNNKRISNIVDFTNAKDCFPSANISGGVCYFLWEKEYEGDCNFTSVHDGRATTLKRSLSQYPVLIRHNEAIEIVKKVRQFGETSFSELISSINPFGFPTSERGGTQTGDSAKLYHSKGFGWVKRSDIKQGHALLNSYKVMISQTTSEHAGEPGRDGKFKLLSTLRLLEPNELCTFSYITAGPVADKSHAQSMLAYLKTRFARFLILQATTSIHLSKDKFIFLPVQDWSESQTDEALYEKYGLTGEEIGYIEGLIKPMEARDE